MQTITRRDQLSRETFSCEWWSAEAIYVPFLGRVIEVKSRAEANAIAQASDDFRNADFIELPLADFELLIAAATLPLSDATASQVKDRAEDLRRQGV